MWVLILDKKKLALLMAIILGYTLILTTTIPELKAVGAIIIIISLYYAFNYVIRKQRLREKKSSSDLRLSTPSIL